MTNSKEPGHIRNGVCVPDKSDDEPEEALSDATDAREAAYETYRRDIENAWRLK